MSLGWFYVFLFCTNGHSKKFVSILYEFHFRVPILSCLEMDLLFLPMYYFLYGSILFKIMDMPLEPPKYSFSTLDRHVHSAIQL